MAEYPEVSVKLDLDDRTIDVFSSDYDLVIRIGELEDSSLVAQRIATSGFICAASPEYLKQYGIPKDPEELREHECLIYEQSARMDNWLFKKSNQRQFVNVKGRLVTNNGEVLCRAAVEHRGISYAPEFVLGEAVANGELTPILTDYQLGSANVYAVYPSRHYLPFKIKRLIEFLKDRLGTEPTH